MNEILYERQFIDKNQEYQGERFIKEHDSHFEVDMPVGILINGEELHELSSRSNRSEGPKDS